MPESVRSLILRKTEGNPFFIEEVVRGLIADGSIVADAGGARLAKAVDALVLPDTVEGVIAARIDRLDEAVKSVLKLASVIGRSFFVRILQMIAESVSSVASGLEQLERAELIRLRQQLPELEYIFKHVLVQETAYASILVERRRTIHRSVARAIESLFAERSDEFAGVLAYHYALAEDWDKAQAYLFRAGDQAGRMAADAEALEHYRQAETAYLNVAAHGLEPLQRAMLDRKLGQALYGVGRYDEAVEHFSRALSQLGIRYPTTRAGVRGSTLKFLAQHFMRRLGWRARMERPSLDLATAREISATCRALAWLDYLVDEERFALDSLIELHAGERSGDVVARGRGLATLGVVLIAFGAFWLARRRIAEALAIANDSGEPSAIGDAQGAQGWLQWVTGSLAQSVRSFELAAAALESIGDIRVWGGCAISLVWAHMQRADFAQGAQLAARLIRVGRDSGDPHVLCWGLTGQGKIASVTGPLDEAASPLAPARDLALRTSSFRMQAGIGAVLGRCRSRQGRVDEAVATLREAIALIDARKLRGHWSAESLNAYAEVCVAKADRASGASRRSAIDEAARACTRALRWARNAVTWEPEVRRLQGTLAWRSGNESAARDEWDQGVAMAERLGLPVERARTLLEIGDRRGDAGQVDEAIRVFADTGAKVACASSAAAGPLVFCGGLETITARTLRWGASTPWKRMRCDLERVLRSPLVSSVAMHLSPISTRKWRKRDRHSLAAAQSRPAAMAASMSSIVRRRRFMSPPGFGRRIGARFSDSVAMPPSSSCETRILQLLIPLDCPHLYAAHQLVRDFESCPHRPIFPYSHFAVQADALSWNFDVPSLMQC